MPEVDIDGAAVHYRVHGDTGPWVTLLHGGLVASPAWDRQVMDLSPNLTDAGRVLVPDLPGYGRSAPLPEARAYRVTDFARRVSALWDALDVDRSVVVGFSVGGMIAQELALAEPTRVRALVLASTAGAVDEPLAEAYRARADAVEAGGLDEERAVHLDKAFSASFREDQPEVLDAYRAEFARNQPDVVAATLRAVAAHDALDRVADIACPTLVLCGDQDPGFGPAAAAALAERIPGAELVTVPGVGHTLQIENPNVFNGRVLEFLFRLDAG